MLLPPAAPDEREPGAEAPEVWPASFTVVVTEPAARVDAARFVELTGRPADWLELGTPLAVDTLAEREAAEALRASLAAGGIEAHVVVDATLGTPGPTTPVRAATLTTDTLELEGRDGRPFTMPFATVRLVVNAFIADPDQPDDSHFIRRSSAFGKVETVGGGAGMIHVVDLYARSAHPLRIVGERFDYALLGPARGLLATDNFALLGELMLELVPDARHDHAFARLETRFLKPVNTGPESDSRRLEIYGRRLFLALEAAAKE